MQRWQGQLQVTAVVRDTGSQQGLIQAYKQHQGSAYYCSSLWLHSHPQIFTQQRRPMTSVRPAVCKRVAEGESAELMHSSGAHTQRSS